MNETEWLCSMDPTPMLEFLWGKASDRKLRLFACACCRRVWHLISNERSRTVVEVAERYADGLANPDALVAARNAAPFYEGHLQEGPIHIFACDAASNVGLLNPWWAAAGAATETLAAVRDAPWIDNRSAPEDFIDAHGACVDERNTQASLLREIVGNPFRPVATDPAWQTPTVLALAQEIYDDRTFDRLPFLADVLEEAGCGSAEILNHLRGPGPHVRGCWVVDAILGKT
jgi:hypothetical protein